MVVDPVCGMEVKTSKSLWKLEIEGENHHFCGSVCMQTFSKNLRKDMDIDIGRDWQPARNRSPIQ